MSLTIGAALAPAAVRVHSVLRDHVASASDVHEDLLAKVAAGSAEAVGELYDAHSAAIFGLALRITRDRGLAEDVTQETFVAIWTSAARFDPLRGSVRTWIMAIAHNRAIDAVRRRRAVVLSLDEDDSTVTMIPPSPDVWPEVSARLDAAVVKKAFARLPESQRRCLDLAYFGGLTHSELAAATGVSLGTAKSRVRLGLARMRALLSQEYETRNLSTGA